ncbi:3-deoxy-D-manno-octulosonic acid transferase [Variovorax sp. HJSM1_2]|uniref:3-deoxy-D-manno-octulosonic acid transferase n=1 Tax=Variovorax sp. HJSM1_2 TaxID=3366263 RepID=UPI003BC191B2
MQILILRFYSFLMWLVQPLLRRKLRRRGQAEPGYLEAVPERFGYYAFPGEDANRPDAYVWVHAVSFGETRTTAILLAALRRELPGMRLLLTHGTATGRAEGARLLQPGDVQAWQPWDSAGAVQRFLQHFRPRIGILMETEIWPNLVDRCRRAHIPLVLANARLSEKSLRQAERLPFLARPVYSSLYAVWAQASYDAERLKSLGAPVEGIFGNIKFDAAPDSAKLQQGRTWRLNWRAQQHTAGFRPVVMLASAREGEELLLLQEIRRKMAGAPAAKVLGASESGALDATSSPPQWLIVPRHPQRFDEVAALVQAQGFTVSRRSAWAEGPEAADVWLGDSLGEMALYYGLADMALLGGSFAELGGQNLIEAAACGCPVLMGPSTFNFAEAANLSEAAGAARRVTDMSQALQVVDEWRQTPEALAAAAAAGPAFANAHRGAADKTAKAVAAILAR